MNTPSVLCANCHQPLPSGTLESISCPNCGHIAQRGRIAFDPVRRPVGWLIFLAVLLFPALLTLLTAKSQALWPICTFVVGGLAALYCGFWLSWRICQTKSGRVIVGVLLSGGFYVVSFFLCCAGCALGGAKLNFQ